MKAITAFLCAFAATTTTVYALPSDFEGQALDKKSPGATKASNCYTVSGVGVFTTMQTYSFNSQLLPIGLTKSQYVVHDQSSGAPWNHGFNTSLAYAQGGYFNLVVPGGQKPASDPQKAIYGGELSTTATNILYASVRTKAVLGAEPGTCQGQFSYHDDNNEIDIEYLSNSSSLANPSPKQPPVFWYTNQPGSAGSETTGPAPSDVRSAVHEYRIDWLPGASKFYIDGVLQKTITKNVPRVGSAWVWNNWANGDPYWSTGPPLQDNVFKIQSITMYYNTTSGGSC